MDAKKSILELVYIIVFIILIVIIVAILLYDFMPNQTVPQEKKYTQAKSTVELLENIEQKQIEDEEGNDTEVLKSYEVTENTLNVAEKQKEFVEGKNHPFIDYTGIKPESDSITNSNSSNSTSTSTSTNSKIPSDTGNISNSDEQNNPTGSWKTSK